MKQVSHVFLYMWKFGENDIEVKGNIRYMEGLIEEEQGV
jgi:hypothetical protein